MTHVFNPGDLAYSLIKNKWVQLSKNNNPSIFNLSLRDEDSDNLYMDDGKVRLYDHPILLPLNPYDPTDPLNPPEFRYPFFLNGRPVRVGDELNVIGFIKPHTVIALSIESDKCLCSVTDCSPLELSYKYFSWPLEPFKKKTTYLWAIPVFGISGSMTVDFKRMTQEEGERYWKAKIVPDSEKEDP